MSIITAMLVDENKRFLISSFFFPPAIVHCSIVIYVPRDWLQTTYICISDFLPLLKFFIVLIIIIIIILISSRLRQMEKRVKLVKKTTYLTQKRYVMFRYEQIFYVKLSEVEFK